MSMFSRFTSRGRERESAYAHQLRVHAAFVNVFGSPEARSDDQSLVMEELRRSLGVDKPVFTGSDVVSAAVNDGMRRAFFILESRVLTEPKPVGERDE